MSGFNPMNAVIVTLTVLLTSAPSGARAEGPSRGSGKHLYLIIVTHDGADCLHRLDDWAKNNKSLLAKVKWGCPHGVHTGWVEVEATSEQSALALIPSSSRGEARAIRVEALDSASRLKSIHRQVEQMYALQKLE